MVKCNTDRVLGQKGAISVMALVFMVMCGVMLAGLMPFISGQMKSTAVKQDVLQAQYAAEAGAKRAIVTLAQVGSFGANNIDWTWLNTNCDLDTDTGARYNVQITRETAANSNTYISVTPPNAFPLSLDPNTIKYRVQSTGIMRNARSTVSARLDVTNGVVGFTTISWSGIGGIANK